MCFRRRRLGLAAALLLAACGRPTAPEVRTVAILPFENLARQDLGWMSRGFPEALRLELLGTARNRPLVLGALRDVPAAGAVRVVHGYYSAAGGRLNVHADIEDFATHRMERTISLSGALADGMLPLAREIARQIDPEARELPTRSEAAMRAYSLALDAGGEQAARGFEQAVSADPGFGAAYLAWAETLVSRNDRPRAAQVAAAARANANRFPRIENARVGVLSAALAGDRAAHRKALAELVDADPGDVTALRTLAELDTLAHSYASAARWYERALERNPGDVVALNQLGYSYAWAGDLKRAVEALERYRALRPNEANPIDSLGDVHYYVGRFAEAAKLYEEAHAKDAGLMAGGDLYKAAWARLMQGDLKSADATFARFLAARKAAQDVVAYRQAQWEYVTGRRRQANVRLVELAKTAPPPVASLAWAQLGIWSLETGDRARAMEYARKAPVPGPFPLLCAFLAQPPAPAAEWTARAERIMPQPAQAGLRQLAIGYALLLSKDFAGAAGPLRKVWESSPPTSPDWPPVLLAWALVESGRFESVPELLAPNPAPEPAGERPFLSLAFPRVFYLRGALADQQHRREDARANYKRFLELAGDAPDFFGERDRAAKALVRLAT